MRKVPGRYRGRFGVGAAGGASRSVSPLTRRLTGRSKARASRPRVLSVGLRRPRSITCRIGTFQRLRHRTRHDDRLEVPHGTDSALLLLTPGLRVTLTHVSTATDQPTPMRVRDKLRAAGTLQHSCPNCRRCRSIFSSWKVRIPFFRFSQK